MTQTDLAKEAELKNREKPVKAVEVEGLPYTGLKLDNPTVDMFECLPGWKAIPQNKKFITMARTIGYLTEQQHVVKILLHPEMFDLETDPQFVVYGDTYIVVCKQSDDDARRDKDIADWHARTFASSSPNITEKLTQKR